MLFRSRFGAGAQSALVVSGGEGFLVVDPNGDVAAVVRGTASFTVPGVSMSASVSIEINTSGSAVNTSIVAESRTFEIALAAGPFLRVRATGASLSIGGQSITADFVFERDGDRTAATLRNARVVLGSPTPAFTLDRKSTRLNSSHT